MQWRCPRGLYGLRFLGFLLLMTGCAGISRSQPPSPEISSHERTLLADSFAAEKLWTWQKRLNLQQWNISVEVVRASELRPKTLGNIHWDLDKKTATIRVLDPADYTLPFHAMLNDIEFTVVHELIHLELVPVLTDEKRTDANRRQEEFAVNHMASALLQLDRQK